MKALRAGKHLYSQKPVGLTVEEVTEQIEAAKAAGVKYTASPIHMLRDDTCFAKKLIADGCIGEIMKVHTNVCHGGRNISSTARRTPPGSTGPAAAPCTTWASTALP